MGNALGNPGNASQVFRSRGIVNELRNHYPIIASLLQANIVRANDALHCGLIQYNFEVGYEGFNDGVKVWREFKVYIDEYVDRMMQSVAARYRDYLNDARITISDHIHQHYINKLPNWPRVGGENVASVELDIAGSYLCGNFHVFWSCVDAMTVTDTRPHRSTLQAHFTGSPDIQVAFIDLDKISNLESEIDDRGFSGAKRFIDAMSSGKSSGLTHLNMH